MAAKPNAAQEMPAVLGRLTDLDRDGVRLQWRNHFGGAAPAHLPRWLLLRLLAYRIQAQALGDLDKATLRTISTGSGEGVAPFAKRAASTREGFELKSGSLLTREWQGRIERVVTLDEGFAWNGKTYGSLSQVAKAITGTSWNGHRFFGLKKANAGATKRAPTQERAVEQKDGGSDARSRALQSSSSQPPPPIQADRKSRIRSEACR